jgi:hypothetical protein
MADPYGAQEGAEATETKAGIGDHPLPRSHPRPPSSSRRFFCATPPDTMEMMRKNAGLLI